MPNRIPTPGIKEPAVRKSPIATPKATQKVDKSEAMLKTQLKAGKVKDITKAKEAIAKKTGVWPNGRTN